MQDSRLGERHMQNVDAWSVPSSQFSPKEKDKALSGASGRISDVISLKQYFGSVYSRKHRRFRNLRIIF